MYSSFTHPNRGGSPDPHPSEIIVLSQSPWKANNGEYSIVTHRQEQGFCLSSLRGMPRTASSIILTFFPDVRRFLCSQFSWPNCATEDGGSLRTGPKTLLLKLRI